MTKYVLDVSFFFQAHHMDHPLDEDTSFWERIKRLAHDGAVVSIDQVWFNIRIHDHPLRRWCSENLPGDFFKNAMELGERYKMIVEWAMARRDRYLTGALHDFLSAYSVAPWLVAYALEHACTITTYERNLSTRRHKITLPEVCDAFGVPYVNAGHMLRQLGMTD